MDDEEIIRRVNKKKGLILLYHDNFKKYMDLKIFPKSSEFLWGMINGLVTSLAYLDNEKVTEKTSFVKKYLLELSERSGNLSLYRRFSIANELHSNFYTGYLEEDEFNEKVLEVEKLIDDLMDMLQENFEKKVGVPWNE